MPFITIDHVSCTTIQDKIHDMIQYERYICLLMIDAYG